MAALVEMACRSRAPVEKPSNIVGLRLIASCWNGMALVICTGFRIASCPWLGRLVCFVTWIAAVNPAPVAGLAGPASHIVARYQPLASICMQMPTFLCCNSCCPVTTRSFHEPLAKPWPPGCMAWHQCCSGGRCVSALDTNSGAALSFS